MLKYWAPTLIFPQIIDAILHCRCGVVDKALTLYTSGSGFDPHFHQSVG